MKGEPFQHQAADGTMVHCFRWRAPAPKASIYIAHGMGEHAARYDRLALALNDAGYSVVSNDHRGHGNTATTLGDFGPDGWNRIQQDMYAIIRSYCTDGPLVLLGHSMGAMLSQQFVTRHGGALSALVLSGTPGFMPTFRLLTGLLLAWWEKKRLAPLEASELMARLLFESANQPFEQEGKETTGFEWLTRDPDEMQKYLDDPWCGFVPFPASLVDMYRGVLTTQSSRAIRDIPSNLPIYLLSGSDDPVHGELANIERMLRRWGKTGIRVQQQIYPGGRHELFNETNRDDVTAHLIEWLDQTLF